MNKEVSPTKSLLEVVVAPFEPVAMGSGRDRVEKKRRVAQAIRDRIPPSELAELQKHRGHKLVGATVSFFLWKGSSATSVTRSVKDLDSLLEVLFDALKPGPPGIGIIESDSYICRVIASKELVDREDQEGFRLYLEEIQDGEMLHIVRKHQL